MVRYATCIEVIFLTAGRPSGAALLRLWASIWPLCRPKKSTLLRIGLGVGHTTPERVLWSNRKLRFGNLLKTGG